MMSWIDRIGWGLWHASWQAAGLAILAGGVCWMLGNRLAPRWKFMLGLVVVTRFLLIITPPSPWSIFNGTQLTQWRFRDAVAATRFRTDEPELSKNGTFNVYQGNPNTTISTSLPMPDTLPEETGVGIHTERTTVSAAPASTVTRIGTDSISWTKFLWATWAIGAGLVGSRILLASWRLHKSLSRCRLVTDRATVQSLAELCRDVGIPRVPRLLVTPGALGPSVTGTWRPSLIIPEFVLAGMPPSQQRYIFMHELAHIARRDLWTDWGMIAVQILHWFNPVAWFTIRVMKGVREASCDDIATASLSNSERRGYGETLLEMVHYGIQSSLVPGMIGLFSSQKTLERRLERIMCPTRTVPGRYCALWIVCFALSGLTDGMPIDQDASRTVPTPTEQSPADAQPRTAHHTYIIEGTCYEWMEQAYPGKPLSGVQLKLYAAQGLKGEPQPIAETRSDDQGQFKFHAVEPPVPHGRLNRLRYGIVGHKDDYATVVADDYHLSLSSSQLGAPARKILHFHRGKQRLFGRITNERGTPVVGATVSQFGIDERSIRGIQSGTTDHDGLFYIPDFPIFHRSGSSPANVYFYVEHLDYPHSAFSLPLGPEGVHAVMPTGCTLTGLVFDEVTSKPVSDAIVSAIPTGHFGPDDERRTLLTSTDTAGRYRIVVRDRPYHIVAEAHDRICTAIANQQCEAGESIELPTLRVSLGGLISGRVVNEKTLEPVVTTERGERVSIGLFGPSRPTTDGYVSPLSLVETDDQGRFTLRAASGKNFPYFVNIHGNRMAWELEKADAVVVEEGKTTHVEMLVEVPATAAEKMEPAKRIVADLPKEAKARTVRIIEEFGKFNHTVDETEVWCSLMRELVTIGPVATPLICAEMDRTDEQNMLRRLAFSLRAIGDKRAIPALIRAIPKGLKPPSSDYGLLVDDADLTTFMQQHDHEQSMGGRYFSLGRPMREICSALHVLTGRTMDDNELYSVMLSKDRSSRAAQQRLYYKQATRWSKWWDKHWREFTDDESYRSVKLPEEPMSTATNGPKFGPNAKVGEGIQGMVLSPANERGGTYFLDLDTGFTPKWPTQLVKDTATPEELSAWAAEQGVDLMCVTLQSEDDTESETFALSAFGMQLSEISQKDANRFDRHVEMGRLPDGRVAGDLLLHVDEATQNTVPDANAAFIYTTREGGMGLIEVTDRILEARDITGMPFAPKGVGFHRGVRFNVRPIVQE